MSDAVAGPGLLSVQAGLPLAWLLLPVGLSDPEYTLTSGMGGFLLWTVQHLSGGSQVHLCDCHRSYRSNSQSIFLGRVLALAKMGQTPWACAQHPGGSTESSSIFCL